MDDLGVPLCQETSKDVPIPMIAFQLSSKLRHIWASCLSLWALQLADILAVSKSRHDWFKKSYRDVFICISRQTPTSCQSFHACCGGRSFEKCPEIVGGLGTSSLDSFFRGFSWYVPVLNMKKAPARCQEKATRRSTFVRPWRLKATTTPTTWILGLDGSRRFVSCFTAAVASVMWWFPKIGIPPNHIF